MKLLLNALVFVTGTAAAGPSVFEHVNVVPMTTGTVLRDYTVVTDGDHIVAVGKASDVSIPPNALRIAAEGKYLVPGLHDMHAHFFGGKDGAECILRLHALNGVTTILNMRGTSGALEMRGQVARGERIGPTIFTTSPILGNADPNPKTYEKGVEAVEEFHAQGYDFIKVYNQIPAEGYRGVVETAHRLGMPVIGHAVRAVGIEGAIASGQHVAHMEEFIYGYFGEDLNEAAIAPLATRLKDAGICVVATLITYHNIIRQVEDIQKMLASPGIEYLPQALVKNWFPEMNTYLRGFNQQDVDSRLRPAFEFQRKLTKRFRAAGVPIMTGTDCTIPIVVPGYALHDELAELVDAGLTPYQAIEAATAAPAKFLGVFDNVGSIEQGKRADLILLEDNPLENIRNTQHRAGVMVRGRWFDKDEVRRLLEELKPTATSS
ncbi:MAG: amidohydrolase family protein [Candidatus Hydrogenedentota bacterium]